MKTSHPPVHQTGLRFAARSERIGAMEPTPVHHRDRDRDAVQFAPNRQVRCIVHVQTMPAAGPAPRASEAMRNGFEGTTVLARSTLRRLRIG